MEKEVLLKELKSLSRSQCDDFETTHYRADKLLIQYINDKEIEEAYNNVGKWYS